jgi:hypothetical protein
MTSAYGTYGRYIECDESNEEELDEESNDDTNEEESSNEESIEEDSSNEESNDDTNEESDQQLETPKRKRKKHHKPNKEMKWTHVVFNSYEDVVCKKKLRHPFCLNYEFNQGNPKPSLPSIPSILEWTKDEHIELIRACIGVRPSYEFETEELSKNLTTLEHHRNRELSANIRVLSGNMEEFSENMEEFNSQSSKKTYNRRIGNLLNEIQVIGTGHYNTFVCD